MKSTQIATEWFLALDADYVLTEALIAELATLRPRSNIHGYSVSFRYCIAGMPLRGTLYPDVTVLCRRGFARYEQVGHTQRVMVNGTVERLAPKIMHDDRKPLSRWLTSQQRYAQLEAEYLLAVGNADVSLIDRVRRRGLIAPILVFIYTLFRKGCIFDGWRGWFYVLQRTFAEFLIALEIVDRRLRK